MTMIMKSQSKLVEAHKPCDNCGSSDALATYDDGHTYCFSCRGYSILNKNNLKDFIDGNRSTNSKYRTGNKEFRINEQGILVSDSIEEERTRNTEVKKEYMNNYTYQYIDYRGITRDTYRAYGVKFKVDEKDKPLSCVFPYGESASKERFLDAKNFQSHGAMNEASLFGMDRFSSASAKSITITEGELDALSVYQLMGSKYPAVSVRSASSARRDCERRFQYLNAFERIYLCFDNDEPGQKALREVSQLFDVNKVYHVKLDRFKDANEYLTNGAEKEFVSLWWNARPYLPKGIVASYTDVENILRKESTQALAEYPFSTLNTISYGIRSKELILFTAQEKVGKTEVMRAIEYHLLKTTDHNVGIIHLEEEEKRSVEGLVGYELNVPAHLPDSGLSIEDKLKAFKSLTKTDGRVHFYTHFGSDDPNTILDIIRHLVGVCHCKFIFLDHITMLVTGFEDEDERKKLDYISTRLAMMTRELDFTLFLVSHVNDNGQTRGSRNISKVADLIISLDRNIEGLTEDDRNRTTITCRGNRYAGITGPAGVLVFDSKTFTLKEHVIPKEESYDPGF